MIFVLMIVHGNASAEHMDTRSHCGHMGVDVEPLHPKANG